jgi:hypothetical protein
MNIDNKRPIVNMYRTEYIYPPKKGQWFLELLVKPQAEDN